MSLPRFERPDAKDLRRCAGRERADGSVRHRRRSARREPVLPDTGCRISVALYSDTATTNGASRSLWSRTAGRRNRSFAWAVKLKGTPVRRDTIQAAVAGWLAKWAWTCPIRLASAIVAKRTALRNTPSDANSSDGRRASRASRPRVLDVCPRVAEEPVQMRTRQWPRRRTGGPNVACSALSVRLYDRLACLQQGASCTSKRRRTASNSFTTKVSVTFGKRETM